MKTTFRCEIHAPNSALPDLAAIVRFCAKELGYTLDLLTNEVRAAEATITLHLSAEEAAAQHPVWCLACRLACFCPNARVSVLIRAGTEFGTAPRRQERRAIAS